MVGRGKHEAESGLVQRAALLVADKIETLGEGVALAAASIDDGRAAQALARLVDATNRP